MLYFVVGRSRIKGLTEKALSRLNSAFRPSTQAAYSSMFRVFVAFCCHMGILMSSVNVKVLLAFLECLNENGVSPNMLSNYVSAIKAKFVIYGLPTKCLESRRIYYYVKSLRINRPLNISRCNIISIEDLYALVACCDELYMGQVFKALFLMAFFGFFRLSNLCPHSLDSYDFTRHLSAGDIFFHNNILKVLLKWSKTIQSRDKVKIISLPGLGKAKICPIKAIKKLLTMYFPEKNQPLFQYKYPSGWKVLIDSKVRKTLSYLNTKLGYPPHYFTFHSFRKSGASLAFASHVPLQQIKFQGTWSSDCVWSYIHSNPDNASQVATTFSRLYSM